MTRLLALPIALPLAAAAACVFSRGTLVRRALGFGATGAVLAYGLALVAATSGGQVLAAQMGGWPPGIAIALAGDLFSALMLVVAALMVLVCTAFAVSRGEDSHPFFHPLVLVLAAGMAGAFLTADLFNLFVFFEVMLIASYVLLTLSGSKDQVRAGAVYVTTNLLASTVLVGGVALAYGVAGTVNMAGLAQMAGTSGGLAVAGGLLLVAFGVKASLVPLHGWLPRAYPAAPPAVAALFSGLLTKVGVYALYRVYAVVFGGDPAFRGLLLAIAAAAMLLGVLGAVGREGMREILSFHITSQVGYMIMGLGLFGPLGLAGGIFYILHHIVVKTSLFLSAGAVETLEGTGQLNLLGGTARRRPVLAGAFALAAFSLAGLPPLSGFFAKLALVRAAFEEGGFWVAALSIGVSFLTLLSMVKIWNGVFWGERQDAPRAREEARVPLPVSGGAVGLEATPPPAGDPGRPGVVAPAVVLALVSAAVGVWAEGLFTLAARAAAGLVDPSAYVGAVLGR